MRRRQFITLLGGAAAAWPFAARAQRGERMRLIGVLIGAGAVDPAAQALYAAFLERLQHLGWTEGRNVRIDTRWTAGKAADTRKYAAELAALAPDIIVAIGSSVVAPLLQTTRTVPIVFTIVADPVGSGFVDSLSRPGGNATGFMQFEYSCAGKWLELLKEIAPGVTRAAVLRDSADASGIGQFAIIQSVAPSVGVDVSPLNMGDAAAIERTAAAFARAANGGLIVSANALAVVHRDLIITLAARHNLPTVYFQRFFVAGGGLISYGANYLDLYRPLHRHAGPPPASRPTPVAAKPAPVGAMSPAGNPGVHVVAQGETLTKISRLYGKPISEIAKANKIPATSKLSAGDRLVIPGMRVSAAIPKATPTAAQVAQAKPAPVAAPKEPERAVVSAPIPEAAPSKDSAKVADATGAPPKFRWPANGRVIAAYGPTPNGQQNDGINIALPENTPVKAAEGGLIAYAGNELKGYGNLVLVRHPKGYVTAYAHAKELLVKRGDQVKRGQVIARSGQTGNVNAPQLHFEIRKGAAPLDPIKFLNGV